MLNPFAKINEGARAKERSGWKTNIVLCFSSSANWIDSCWSSQTDRFNSSESYATAPVLETKRRKKTRNARAWKLIKNLMMKHKFSLAFFSSTRLILLVLRRSAILLASFIGSYAAHIFNLRLVPSPEIEIIRRDKLAVVRADTTEEIP